jgi:hypothetical protein
MGRIKNRLFFYGKVSRSVLAPCPSTRSVTRGFVMYILFLLYIVWINVCIRLFELFHLQYAASGQCLVFGCGVEGEECER